MEEMNLNTHKFHSWKSPKPIIMLVALVLVAGIVVVSILRDRIVSQQQWQVSVVGRGEVTYTPDIAKVTIGVQVEKVFSAEAALNQLNQTVDKVLAAVAKEGIDKADIQTQSYNLYPQYNYVDSISQLAGYGANQQLVITVKNLTPEANIIGKVIGVATQAGANQVNSITFESSKIDQYKQEARLKAINDARDKASALSQAAGVKLGKVVGWWENFVQGPDTNYYDGKGGVGMGAGAAAPTAQVPVGTPKLIVEMNLNYQVK